MIKLSEESLSAWLRYYYAANSVGYLVRHAKNDIFASMLSNRNSEELFGELSSSLATKPESPEDVVRPYVLAAALASKGGIPKDKLIIMDAQYTKWFHEYVESLFSVSKTSKLISSSNEWRMSSVSSSPPRSRGLMSNTSFAIDGRSK